MLISLRHGQSGVILRIKILDATKSDGSGLTGLSSSSSGLVISTIADSEATPVVYRTANAEVEPITTPGTYEAPSLNCCRFSELNPTLHRGVYELQLPDSRFAATGAKSLLVTIAGAVNVAESDALIPLTTVDPYAPNFGFDPWAASLPASYALGTAGALMGCLDSPISSRLAASTYSAPSTPAAVAAAVWDEPSAGHAVAGSFGARVDASVSTRMAASSFVTPPTAATIAAAVWDEPIVTHTGTGSFGRQLDAQISTRSTYSGGVVAGVTGPVTVATVLDKSGYSLASGGLDAILVEPGVNVRQAFSPMLAALAGVVSGAGTGTIVIKGANTTTTRVTATVDSVGNRSTVILALPS